MWKRDEETGLHIYTFMYKYYLYVHIFIGGRSMFVMIRFCLISVYKFLPFSAGNHLYCIIFAEEKGGVWRYLVRYCMEYYTLE
jgi:hypothetical protein